jgi:NAD(P)-dependent dehydrogenase (short-subunit alcohol dehydrogenase family)
VSLGIDLTGKRALVTGVTSGLGAGIAATLAAAGADVAGCGLEAADHEGALAFSSAAATAGRHAYYRACDVAEAAAARDLVDWAAGELGGLDLVVSNAGKSYFIGAAEADDAAWQANLDLNLAAHWRIAQAARPWLLQAAQPVIVVIASNHAYYSLPGCFPYNIAKAGLLAMVQSLAMEWGPHVRAVGVAPGFIDAPMSARWFESFPDPAAKRAQVVAIHPIGRLGTPADIGNLVAFLCSPLSGYITGTTVLIDGGRSTLMQDS